MKGRLELTPEAANELINLIDIALRTEGAKVGNNAMYFIQAIHDSFKSEEANKSESKNSKDKIKQDLKKTEALNGN